jgi:hypothetical protein
MVGDAFAVLSFLLASILMPALTGIMYTVGLSIVPLDPNLGARLG